jgi:DNA-binding PadR family transcriptional regulator
MESFVNLNQRSYDEVIPPKEAVGETSNINRKLAKNANSTKTWKITMTDLQILSLLESHPMTGYAVRKSLLSHFGIKISFGTLYPRLRYFERLRMLKPTKIDLSSGGLGIQYELTEKGKVDLEMGLKYLQKTFSMIELTREPLLSAASMESRDC